jgi:hypothetical protein
MNERLIKCIDQTVASFAVKSWAALCSGAKREYSCAPLNEYKNFAVIRPGGMGDAALLLPLLRFLKSREKHVTLICNSRNSERRLSRGRTGRGSTAFGEFFFLLLKKKRRLRLHIRDGAVFQYLVTRGQTFKSEDPHRI